MPQWRAARQASQEGRDQAEADQGAGGGNGRARREDQALSRTRPAGEGIAPNSTQRVDNESGTPDKTGSRFRTSGTTCSSRANRQVDGEGGARAGYAVDLNRSPVRFHDPPGDVEAQPEPAVMAAGDSALESVEDARQVLGRDADPVVAHRELKPGRVAPERDVDRLSAAELDGVGEKIGDDL